MKTLQRFTLLNLLLPLFLFSYAQESKPAIASSDWLDQGISLGFSGAGYLYGELGYFRSHIFEAGFPLVATTLNVAMEISHRDQFLLAPKIQGRIYYSFFTGALSILYYTDTKDKSSLRLRPELGIGLWNFDLMYGYNLRLYQNEFTRLNKHQIGIRFYLKAKRKTLHEYDNQGNVVNP